MFRALIAARKPKSTTTTASSFVEPESTAIDNDVQSRNSIQATIENVNYVPQAEVNHIDKSCHCI